MIIKKIDGEELKSSNDMAKELKIAESTVRKYANMLNDVAKRELFEFINNKRYFKNTDIDAFKTLLLYKTKSDLQLHDIISSIYVEFYADMQEADTLNNLINKDDYVSKSDISVLQDEVKRNNELLVILLSEIKNLSEENKELKSYLEINNKMLESDLVEDGESIKEETKNEKKKKWYSKFFN